MAGLWDAAPAVSLEVRARGGGADDWLPVTDRVMWQQGGVQYERGRNPGTLRWSPGQLSAVLDNTDGSLSPGSTTTLGQVLGGDFEVRLRCNPPADVGPFNMVRDGSFEDADTPLPWSSQQDTRITPASPYTSATGWSTFWCGDKWVASASDGRLLLTQNTTGNGYMQTDAVAVIPGDVITFDVTMTVDGNAPIGALWLYLSNTTAAGAQPFGTGSLLARDTPWDAPHAWTPGETYRLRWTYTVPALITTGAGTSAPAWARPAFWCDNTSGTTDGQVTFADMAVTLSRPISSDHDTTRANPGVQSAKVSLPAASMSAAVLLDMADLDLLPGVLYEISARVYNPSTGGVTAMRLTGDVRATGGGQSTTTKDQWVTLSTTFMSTAGRPHPGIRVEPSWSAGAAVWVDGVVVRPSGGGYDAHGSDVWDDTSLVPASSLRPSVALLPQRASEDATGGTAAVVELWRGDGFSRRYTGNHLQPVVTITAVDMLARLDGLILPGTPVEAELRALAPRHYWPLLTGPADLAAEDDTVSRRDLTVRKRGAATAADIAWGGGPPVGINGPQGLWLESTGTSQVGWYLSTDVALPEYTVVQEYAETVDDPAESNFTTAGPALLLLFAMPTDLSYDYGYTILTVDSSNARVEVFVDYVTGALAVRDSYLGVDSGGASVWVEVEVRGFDVDPRDGEWHALLVTAHPDRVVVSLDGGANGVISYQPGVDDADTTVATVPWSPWVRFAVGGQSGQTGFTGSVAHAALWAYAPDDLADTVKSLMSLARWDLPEPSMVALERVARWSGLDASDPAADMFKLNPLAEDPPLQVFAYVQWAGEVAQKISDIVSRVEASEGGHIYADGQGRLALQSGWWPVDRDTSNRLTLAFADLGGMPTVTFDDRLAADVGDQIAVSTPALPEPITVRLRDQARYAASVDTMAPTVSVAINVASWRSHLGVPSRPAWDEITVDLLALQRWGATSPLWLDVGTWVTFVDVPDQYLSLPAHLTVTGLRVQITLTEWRVTFTGLDRSLFDCLVLDSDVIGSTRVLAPSRGVPGDMRALPGGEPRQITAPDPGGDTPPEPEDPPDAEPDPEPDPDLGSGRTVYTVVTAGDCTIDGGNYRKVVAQIAAIDPDRVLLLGDLVQRESNWKRWKEWFIPTYGQFKSIMWAVPGNHCYRQPNARSYRKYFGLSKTESLNWWQVANGWLFIGLDSQKPGAALTFLQNKLDDNRTGGKRPVVVAWHKPRFVYTSGVPGSPELQAHWNAFHDDPYTRILLHGHDHDWAHRVITRNGRKRDVFVVGTGGGEVRRRGGRNVAPSGVLQLNLRDDGGYRWWYRDALQRRDNPRGKPVRAGKRYI